MLTPLSSSAPTQTLVGPATRVINPYAPPSLDAVTLAENRDSVAIMPATAPLAAPTPTPRHLSAGAAMVIGACLALTIAGAVGGGVYVATEPAYTCGTSYQMPKPTDLPSVLREGETALLNDTACRGGGALYQPVLGVLRQQISPPAAFARLQNNEPILFVQNKGDQAVTIQNFEQLDNVAQQLVGQQFGVPADQVLRGVLQGLQQVTAPPASVPR